MPWGDDSATPPDRPRPIMVGDMPDDAEKIITGEIEGLKAQAKGLVSWRWLALAVIAGIPGAIAGVRAVASDAGAEVKAELSAHEREATATHRLLNDRIDLLKPVTERAANNALDAADTAAKTARQVATVEHKLDLLMEAVAPRAAAQARAQKRADAGVP